MCLDGGNLLFTFGNFLLGFFHNCGDCAVSGEGTKGQRKVVTVDGEGSRRRFVCCSALAAAVDFFAANRVGGGTRTDKRIHVCCVPLCMCEGGAITTTKARLCLEETTIWRAYYGMVLSNVLHGNVWDH